LFINFTPFVPLSILGEGEKKKEGLTPLLDASKVRELKRGEASLNYIFPPFPYKGKGAGG
jgi:hypothetical protein